MSFEINVNNTTKEQIYKVLSDFNSYVEWMPDIAESTVLAQEGDIVIGEFSSPELMEEKYQLEFVCSKPTSIIYKQIGIFEETGSHSLCLSGNWKIIDSPNGKDTIIIGEMKFKANAKKATLILQRRLDALQQKCLLSTTPTEESKPILALSQQIINANQHEEVIVWFLGSEYVVKKNTKK